MPIIKVPEVKQIPIVKGIRIFKPGETVYLYNPENVDSDSAKKFVKEFIWLFKWHINFECVESLDDCKEKYPIALLLIRQTDRADEDIQSLLKQINQDHLDKNRTRVALINIHIVNDTQYLPKIPTAQKVSECYKLGTMLDFGLVDTMFGQTIYACPYDGGINSKQAFYNFVLDTRRENNTTRRGD